MVEKDARLNYIASKFLSGEEIENILEDLVNWSISFKEEIPEFLINEHKGYGDDITDDEFSSNRKLSFSQVVYPHPMLGGKRTKITYQLPLDLQKVISDTSIPLVHSFGELKEAARQAKLNGEAGISLDVTPKGIDFLSVIMSSFKEAQLKFTPEVFYLPLPLNFIKSIENEIKDTTREFLSNKLDLSRVQLSDYNEIISNNDLLELKQTLKELNSAFQSSLILSPESIKDDEKLFKMIDNDEIFSENFEYKENLLIAIGERLLIRSALGVKEPKVKATIKKFLETTNKVKSSQATWEPLIQRLMDIIT